MEALNRDVPGVDGLTLHLVDHGGDGPPLLFAHGFGHGAHLFDALVPALREHFHVLALDNRGHGDSPDDPEFRYHSAAISRDLENVVIHLGHDDVTLVGHSQGGHACIRFAGRHPERMARLVLAESGPEIVAASGDGPTDAVRLLAPSFASRDAYADVLGEVYPQLDAAERENLATHFTRECDDGSVEPKLDERFLTKQLKKSAEWRGGFDRAAWAKKEGDRLWHYLERVTCPTLVIHGENSQMVSSATAQRMVDEVLPRARAVAIAGAGHTLMLDRPREFREAVLEFLL